ncbi:MAG: flagellar protein export ATPase FliI [Oscillospiraceae bacterium]
MSVEKYRRALRGNLATPMGKIDKIIGMMMEATGPMANIGDVCKIYPNISARYSKRAALAEVVGFKEDKVLLMPYDDNYGIGPGNIVESTGEKLMIKVSDELIGRIVDGTANPIDGLQPIKNFEYYPIMGKPTNPLTRPMISEKITMGVKTIDSLLTFGKGQRMGIFAGSGVGKSTLMGMIARNVSADVNVIALVGERGREVREFIAKDLGEEGMKRSILVVATSDQPAMIRSKCALVATAIAEYFKDKGNDVLLMMDSLTRFAMAQREIGLAIGEPPVARGYTPSIYTALPKLLERSGNFGNGSITGLYTVLVEGDDMNEPIADTVRGIIDGHIVLSRQVAMRNHYPAIDVQASVSRLMQAITEEKQYELAGKMRNVMATYYSNYDLITIGAYKKGTNPKIDDAIMRMDRINKFLQQGVSESFTYEQTLELMKEAMS